MTAPERAGYPLGEALALLAPVVGCPVDEAEDYILLVFSKENDAHIGASDRLQPALVAQILRHAADSIEAEEAGS